MNKNTDDKENKVLDMIEIPVNTEIIDDLETDIENEDTEDELSAEELENLEKYLSGSKSEQVPLEPLFLDEATFKALTQTDQFAQGIMNVAELMGELTAVATGGLAPQFYYQMKLQHEEQMKIIKMNLEIAKMNLEASKNMKKEIEIKNEDSSL